MCRCTTLGGLPEGTRGLARLRVVNLSACVAMSGTRAFRNLPRGLTSLSVSRCPWVIDTSFIHLAGLSGLTTLDLSFCEHFSWLDESWVGANSGLQRVNLQLMRRRGVKAAF